MRSNQGFTLVELMITVAVLAIIAAIAAPSFSDLIKGSNNAAEVDEFQASLNLLRSTAINEAKKTSICPLDDSGANPTCDTSATNWNGGYLGFSCAASNSSCSAPDTANGDEIILIKNATQNHQSKGYKTSVNHMNQTSSSYVRLLTFTQKGILENTYYFTFCAESGSNDDAYLLELVKSGQSYKSDLVTSKEQC